MSLIEVHGPHLAEPGSASALWFTRAAEHYARHEAEVNAAREAGTLTKDTGRDAWCAARVAEREGTEAPGYAGRDFDAAIAEDAAFTVKLVTPDIACTRPGPMGKVSACDCPGCQTFPKVREEAVKFFVAAGVSEPRARRSVIDGLLRATNPPGGHKGGLYRAPPPPPEPSTEPKKCA